MTLAVHEPSNSLIITAPDQLFVEVEQLAKLIDKRAEQSMEIVVPKVMNARYVEALLQNALFQNRSPQSPSKPKPASREAEEREQDDRERE